MNGLVPRMASVSDLQRNYKSLLDLVERTKEPVVLLKDNKAKAALLDIGELEKLYMTKQDHEAQKIRRAIISYEKAKKAGKLLSATSVDELFKMVESENRRLLLRKKVSKVSGKTAPKRAKES